MTTRHWNDELVLDAAAMISNILDENEMDLQTQLATLSSAIGIAMAKCHVAEDKIRELSAAVGNASLAMWATKLGREPPSDQFELAKLAGLV